MKFIEFRDVFNPGPILVNVAQVQAVRYDAPDRTAIVLANCKYIVRGPYHEISALFMTMCEEWASFDGEGPISSNNPKIANDLEERRL